jgi:hypothetical protein
MDRTISDMQEEVIKKIGKLDRQSLTLALSNITILQARQEMEKGVADNVAQGNSDIRER